MFLGCNFKPMYQEQTFLDFLCEIKIADTQPGSKHYEESFKNELNNSICPNSSKPKKYLLNWIITKSKTELIGSNTNRTVRYEIKLTTSFSLKNIADNKNIYNDTVYSSSEYNVLEDAIISTLASEKYTEELIVKNLKEIIFNKIYLYAVNNEN